MLEFGAKLTCRKTKIDNASDNWGQDMTAMLEHVKVKGAYVTR